MKKNSIRQFDGKWLNTSVYKKAGNYYEKHGYYTNEPWGSPGWIDFWQRERDKCINGYIVEGHKITGDHYFYLNYCPIQKIDLKSVVGKKAKKIKGFPDFWDGDYEYFWFREIARNGILVAFDINIEEQQRIYTLPEEKKISIYKKYLDKLILRTKPVLTSENLEGGKDLIIAKSRRRGYEQPNSEIVMTKKGYSTMGELKIGTRVLTPEGTSKVIDIFPQGKKDVYEIELYDGRKVRCGLSHLWKVYSKSHRKNYRQKSVVSTKDILNIELKNKYNAFTTFLPMAKTIEYKEENHTIPPYTLGALLGDGGITKQLRLSGVDEEIIKNIIKELNSINTYEGYYKTNRNVRYWGISFVHKDIKTLRFLRNKYNISSNASRVNPIYEKIKELKINCHGDIKFIPTQYKLGTSTQRLELVKGLMDTDGYCSKDGAMSFTSVSKQLCEDLQEVLYSLQIQSTLRKRSTDRCYILYVNSNVNLFKLKRKKERVNYTRRVRKYIAITGVKKLNKKEESSCILIDSNNHLYLTKNYIVTHNSYKNASVVTNSYFVRPDYYNLLMAYEKKYLYPGAKTIFGKVKSYINFVNNNTGWLSPSDVIDRQDHIRNSYIEYKNGRKIEKGFMSEIEAISFKDNPDAGRGSDTYDIIGEEVGAWGIPGGLKSTIAAMRSSAEAGRFKTGMMTLFGTSGAIDRGTADFADLFDRPSANNFMEFYDIWGKYPDKTEGFFFPKHLNSEGFYDENGNSDLEGAKKAEFEYRKSLKKKGATNNEIMRRMQEEALNSTEAFSMISINTFPVIELRQQLEKVKAKGLQKIKGTAVNMLYEDGEIVAKPILNDSKQPIISLKSLPTDLSGCPVIYEQPVFNPPKGLYKIGYDPIRQDEGTSLAAIIVYKGAHIGTQYKNIIVAEYIGRTKSSDDIDRMAEYFAEFYNTTIMHENEVMGVKNYFRRIKKLHLLAHQPDAVISKNIKLSKVARVYGCHMTIQLKDAAERYVKDWLLSILDHDENGNEVRVIDRIYSTRLLEELIVYDRKGNFDLVSALFMCMFQVQEEELGKEHGDGNKNKNVETLLGMISEMYRKD